MPEPEGPEGADADIRAGEYALGVLEGEDLAVAQRAMLADRTFAERVRWWRYRLNRMAEAAGAIEPSPEVWPAIERRLPEPHERDGSAAPQPLARPPVTGLRGWSLAAALASTAAAAATVVLLFVQPPPPRQEAPADVASAASGQRLVAQVQSEDGSLSLAGLVEPDSRRLALNITGFAPAEGQAAELWVVPEGGAPRSLGLIPGSGAFRRVLTAAEIDQLVEGASLAVTYEDAGSAPHEAPSSDILVIGALSRV